MGIWYFKLHQVRSYNLSSLQVPERKRLEERIRATWTTVQEMSPWQIEKQVGVEEAFFTVGAYRLDVHAPAPSSCIIAGWNNNGWLVIGVCECVQPGWKCPRAGAA